MRRTCSLSIFITQKGFREMDRKRILKHIDKKGRGLEIGASLNPVAPKKDGYDVHVIDHASRDDLVKKYQNQNVNTDNIEDVDYVWEGQPYSELTGKRKYYDWIIASHLIEHTPDLIGFLNNCDAILKDDGVIALTVPDKRYCFDHFRPITGISKIIDSHIHKNIIHSPGTVAEYFLNVVSKSGSIAWNSSDNGNYEMIHTLDNASESMDSVLTDNKYIDVHAWCFVPHSFRLILHDLFCLKFIPFQEVDFHTTEGCEFHVIISRNGRGLKTQRLEILKIIEDELNEKIIPRKKLKDRLKNIIKRITKRHR